MMWERHLSVYDSLVPRGKGPVTFTHFLVVHTISGCVIVAHFVLYVILYTPTYRK